MNYRIRYGGSLFWLIFWAIVFFPIAFVLLLTSWHAVGANRNISCHYNGSRAWLAFWVVFFFPLAIFLLLHNGLRIVD